MAEEQPEIVERLLARMEEVQQTVFDPDRGRAEDAEACAALEANGGFWSPWKS